MDSTILSLLEEVALNLNVWPTRGWKTLEPEAAGMNRGVLARVDELVARDFPTLVHLLIVRRGGIVFELSYQQGSATTPVNVKSVTKSVVSALVGLALHKGYLTSLDQRLAEFFPQLFSARADARKGEIRLVHLLTMRSGLRWSEQSAESLPALYASDDWARHALSLPMAHEPGDVFAYSTLDAHLLSAVLAQATQRKTLEFAVEELCEPLGIARPIWTSDPQGYPIGGSQLYLTPHEMAKFGYLYLRRGCWEGRQLLSEEYVAASTRTAVRPIEEPFAPATYGYLWWVRRLGSYASFYALGYGGQLVCVIPALDIVLVVTARADVPPEQGAGTWAFALASELAQRIIYPALVETP